jgi:VWFA-related protein
VIAPLLVSVAQAQQVPPSPAPGPQSPGAVFRSDVQYVEVDAFVTGADGGAVAGLTRDDFEVFEEGVLQEIAAFAEVVVPLERVTGQPAPLAPPPRDSATNEQAVRGRIFTLVLDEWHTDARRSGRVRELASRFVERHMAEGDLASVVTTGDPDAAPEFTSQRQRLLEAVGRFTGRRPPSATLERLSTIDHQKDMLRREPDAGGNLRPEPALASGPGVERDPWDLERAQHARASMEAVARAARGFGDVDGRRKAILLFSEGVDYDTLDVMGRTQREASAVVSGMRDAIATAMRRGVAVYTIDPRGLVGPGGPEEIQKAAPGAAGRFGVDSQSLARELRLSQDSLRTLSEQTGGIAVVDTNDFDTAFDRIVRASSRYYLMGYYPAESRRDGAFRRLEVRVLRPGLSVVAREGYLRPGPEAEKPDASRTAAPEGPSPELRALLDSPWPQPGLPLAVTAAAFKDGGRDASVTVTIELPAPGPAVQEKAAGEIEVSMLALDRNGKARAAEGFRVQPRTDAGEPAARRALRVVRQLQLPPGRYQLRVAARDAGQELSGSVSLALDVPDFAGRALAMSGILLASQERDPAPSAPNAVRGLAAPPVVTRSFPAGHVVTAYAEVYDTLGSDHDVAIATRVTSVDGREVFRDARLRPSSELGKAGSFEHAVEIPLASLRPGRYVLSLTATPTLGDQGVSRELSFEVVAPTAAAQEAGAAALPATGAAPAPAGSAPERSMPAAGVSRPATRIARLEAWLAAVERHQPGTADAPALMVRSWSPPELMELAADIAVLATLVVDPGHIVMWVIDPARPGKPQRAPYSLADEQRLRALASEARARCEVKRPPAREEAACARNRLLKRGAILHTDAVIRVGGPNGWSLASGDRPDQWQVRFADGQQRGA